MLSLISADGAAAENNAQLDSLIAKIALSDKQALASLYRQTKAPVFGYALSVLKNPYDAEDVLHDCFVSVYQAAPSYRSMGKPMAWIITIARNLCMQRLRDASRTDQVSWEETEDYLKANDGVSTEDRLTILCCLKRLTDMERQIVLLHAVCGFRHREIAAFTELPLATVLSKYHRALKKLREYFNGEDGFGEKQ